MRCFNQQASRFTVVISVRLVRRRIEESLHYPVVTAHLFDLIGKILPSQILLISLALILEINSFRR